MTAEELLGVGVELQPEVKEGVPSEGAQTPPTLSIQSVTLDITVTDSSEDGASDGMSAKVPLAAWSSADGGDAQRQAVADVVASMAKFVPVGTEVVVITQSLVPSGPDTVTIQTPGSSLFGGPASVVFASSDSGLVSLDWAVGDDAESYLGAASLDEFVAQVFGRR